VIVRDAAEKAVAEGTCPRVFDYALPQTWVDLVHEQTGIWPQTLGFVWGYPERSTWGLPVPLTPEARALYESLTPELR
jgi:hypothetical protein